MKKFIIATLVCFSSISLLAQHDHSIHQSQNTGTKTATRTTAVNDPVSQKKLAALLTSYYNIKNALVTGDANAAVTNAQTFVTTANSIDYKVISESNLHALATDAGMISEQQDIAKQRQYFANLSTNMAAGAKSLKLADKPVYVQYCPMKKASWLSSEKEIRNPYYGSEMLTCGSVTGTIE